MIDIVATFITFFAVVDPIGTIPVFMAVTSGLKGKDKSKVALKATFIAACILLFFVVAGELILNAMSIPLSVFQVSGGIVLFLFAMMMIFGESKPDEELRLVENDSKYEAAVFPLAVPSIASPGAILAAVLLTENTKYSLLEQVQTYMVLLSVLLVAYVLMLLSGTLSRIVGSSGASVISRVMV